MPIFAAGLGLLEPAKFVPSSCLPISVDEIGSIDGAVDRSEQNSATEHILPPVQFDWTSSGLTNPLDAPRTYSNQIANTAILDLDFFVTKEFGANQKSKPTRVFSKLVTFSYCNTI